MIPRLASICTTISLLFALGACGEKPQTLGASGRKADVAPWVANSGANPAFAASGWKGGDQAAWEAQIRARNQLQNDYAR